MRELSGQSALITGAGRGIGRQTALRLAGAGMRVALCARSGDAVEAVARTINEGGGSALAAALDVRDYGAIEAFVQRTLDAFGGIDALVNNAGLGWYKPLLAWSIEEIDAALDVNLKGLIYATRAVLPSMLERGRGDIVNVASDLGRRAVPNMGPYVAAKHGVIGFAASLRKEVQPHGLRVTTLLPGITDTAFNDSQEGIREARYALPPQQIAEVIHTALAQPAHVALDEITLHPIGQVE